MSHPDTTDYGYGDLSPRKQSKQNLDGYEDDEDVHEHVIHQRASRRASAKAGRRSSATGTDAFAARKARRASLNGGRRASFQGSVHSVQQRPANKAAGKGISQTEALRRLNLNYADDPSVDDDDSLSQSPQKNMYGYGDALGGQARHRQADRRPSNASRASHRSRRRSSHKVSLAEVAMELQDVPVSDLDDSENEGEMNMSMRSSRSRRRHSNARKDEALMAQMEASGSALIPAIELESDDSSSNAEMKNAYGYGNKSSSSMNPYGNSASNLKNHQSAASGLSAYGNSISTLNPYGYGPCDSDTDASAVSRRTSRSHRRNSCVIRHNKDPAIMAEIEAGPAMVPDSDLESDEEPIHNRSNYGYGGLATARPNRGGVNGGGYDSDSTAGGATISSTRPTARRNSCYKNKALLDQEDDAVNKELNDPDSLLSRSGYYNKEKANKGALAGDAEGEEGDEDESNLFKKPNITNATNRIGADQSPSNAPIGAKPEEGDKWIRSTPFTTAHVPPTADKLGVGVGKRGDGLQKSWGDIEIHSNSSKSEESFGASMYNDNKVQVEIDRYKQRARRRASIEASYIDLKYIAPTEKIIVTKEGEENKVHVPHFKPAEGCSKASDFIVRCFSARLRSGITVLKHNRSRFSKSQYRVLYLLPDGKTLTWKPLEGEKDKGRRPKLDLTRCVEVRHAYSPDPDTRKMQGTAVLRKNCKDGMAARSLSLVFGKRTFDMTALSKDLCTVLLEGFSALCFRLHLMKMEEDSAADSDANNHPSHEFRDEDWASTVIGPESTVDLTVSINSIQNGGEATPAPVPWGF